MDLSLFEKVLIQIVSAFLMCAVCFTAGFIAGASTTEEPDTDFNIEDLEK